MKNREVVVSVVMSVMALSFLMAGCGRQVSKTTSTSVSSDGTVKSEAETVTKAPDGTVTKTQESTTTSPNK